MDEHIEIKKDEVKVHIALKWWGQESKLACILSALRRVQRSKAYTLGFSDRLMESIVYFGNGSG